MGVKNILQGSARETTAAGLLIQVGDVHLQTRAFPYEVGETGDDLNGPLFFEPEPAVAFKGGVSNWFVDLLAYVYERLDCLDSPSFCSRLTGR